MMHRTKCPLCASSAEIFCETSKDRYFRCDICLGVFLSSEMLPSKEEERKRYEAHNNDVNDPGYQKFVQPIIEAVTSRYKAGSVGLDFGAGPGPVAAKLLNDKGYAVELYDPFFYDQPHLLRNTYDYVICCEVIEHFHDPAKEFKLLRQLLKPKGALFCMTNILSDDIDFAKWPYKNDKTHVFFYHKRTLEYIRSEYGYSELSVQGRRIGFFV